MTLCDAESSYGYRCSREKGHDGSHVAMGTRNEVLDSWGPEKVKS